MPWSAKAQELLADPVRGGRGRRVGRAAPSGRRSLEQAAGRLDGEEGQARRGRGPIAAAEGRTSAEFVAAYRQYCWPVESLTDLKLAPFHLLATEGHVHTDKNHVWHMETLAEVCRADPELLLATPYKVVDVTDPASQAAGIAWWDGADRAGRRGDGRQAAGLHPPRAGGAWPSPP